MLFQATNIIPDMRSGVGLGTIDATLPMKVSWQVNGDYPVMTAMSITIYANDTVSTQKYTTGKVTFSTPFYGADALGNLQYYSYTITAAQLSTAGITNGNEYKMVITQYYAEGSGEGSVTQSSASVFITRKTPTFALASPPSTVTDNRHTFTVNYSQEQGDTLDWIRYQIAQGSNTEDPIFDSGNIYGAAVYTCTYEGFRSGFIYSFRASGQTSSGTLLDTGWTTFYVGYPVTTDEDAVIVSVEKDVNGVIVDWGGVAASGNTGWNVFREQEGNGVLVKVAETDVSVRRIIDYGAPSGQGSYRYFVTGVTGTGSYTGTRYGSAKIRPIFYRWTLLVCEGNEDGSFTVEKQYHFKYNMDSGSVGNNNAPNVLQNFTANPTVQPAPQNYLSGTLKALIGSVDAGEYTDSLEDRKALMALSVSEKPIFLKSSKGDVLRIRPNGAVTAAITEKTESLAQSVSFPWIALEDAEETAISGIPAPSGNYVVDELTGTVYYPATYTSVSRWTAGTDMFSFSTGNTQEHTYIYKFNGTYYKVEEKHPGSYSVRVELYSSEDGASWGSVIEDWAAQYWGTQTWRFQLTAYNGKIYLFQILPSGTSGNSVRYLAAQVN